MAVGLVAGAMRKISSKAPREGLGYCGKPVGNYGKQIAHIHRTSDSFKKNAGHA